MRKANFGYAVGCRYIENWPISGQRLSDISAAGKNCRPKPALHSRL